MSQMKEEDKYPEKQLNEVQIGNLPEKVLDLGLIPGLGRTPGGGHSNPLQYSCWRIPMDRGAWRATVYGVAKSLT